jgi:DNA-binding transcriptional LysR family regulator
MNLRQLKLFVALAETGSFSQAAERVSLTQSTVSQHVASLEREVEARLIDRTGKGAVLTAAGKLFLQHARRVVAEQEALLQAMAGFRGLQQTELVIGASNIPANYLIPELLEPLSNQYPGIILNMRTGDSRKMLDCLIAAEIELAVIGSRTNDKGVDFAPLASDQLFLVVGPGHPWRNHTKISLDELAAQPIVLRETGSGSGEALHKALSAAGFDPGRIKIAARLGSNEAVRQTVSAGFCCAFLSQYSIRRELETGELCRIGVAGLNVTRQFWRASLKGRTLSPAAAAFCELLCRNLSPDYAPGAPPTGSA